MNYSKVCTCGLDQAVTTVATGRLAISETKGAATTLHLNDYRLCAIALFDCLIDTKKRFFLGYILDFNRSPPRSALSLEEEIAGCHEDTTTANRCVCQIHARITNWMLTQSQQCRRSVNESSRRPRELSQIIETVSPLR